MRVIILAAGEGKRLRPYTDDKPKCMVELAGNSLLSYQLSTIKECNISSDKVALVGGYQSKALDKFNLNKFENVNFSDTNMVSTLFCAQEFMQHDEDLIISYGDIIYEENVLKALLSCENEVCVSADIKWESLWRLRMTNPLEDAETFMIDDKFFIKELGKKPISFSQVHAQYMGLIKIRADKIAEFIDVYQNMNRDITYDGQNFDNMYMTSFIQHLINIGWKVKATLVESGWLEVDTVDDLECFNQMSKEGTLDSLCRL